MAGVVNITLDTREFDQALRDLASTTSKEIPRFLNFQSQKLCFDALDFIKKAAAADIDKLLQEGSRQTMFARRKRLKSGQLSKRRKLSKERTDYTKSRAAFIIIARSKKENKKLLFGAKLDKAVRDMIKAKKRTIGFIKSGWLPAIQAFGASLGQKPRGSTQGVKQLGKPKGFAVIAKRDRNLVSGAYVANDVMTKATRFSKDQSNGYRLGMDALQQAMRRRAADMKQAFENNMRKIFNRYAGRFIR